MITPYQKPEDKDPKANNFWSNLAGKLGLSAPLVRVASAAEQKGQRLPNGIQKHSDMARMEPANLQTTPEFWDCECDDAPGGKPGSYIHPASEPTCAKCGSHKDESPDSRVDEVIKLLGITPTQIEDHGPAGPAREASIQTVSGQAKSEPALIERYSGVFHRAVAELGQSERVKAADRLSRIEADMAAFKDKLNGLGGDKAMGDLVGEVAARADSLSGACVQLRDKVDGLSMSQAQSIENAFFVLSDAKTEIDKIKGNSGDMGMAMTMEMGLPEGGDLEVGGDLPEATKPEKEEAAPSAIAGHVPAFMKKAKDAAYDDLRCIHTKLSLVDSMLSALVSELNVSDMLGPTPMSGAGAPPNGMPPMEEMDGEQKAPKPFGSSPDDDSEKDRSESGLTAGRKGTTRVAASGDPGDSEPGNTIYKSIDKCRDCVWFESDITHETYRDKCKHCIHACLGGAIEHFWPRSQQMVMWIPSWTAPEAKEKKAFTGTLSMVQTAEKVSDAVVNIATDIMDRCAHNAVEMGTALIEYFQEPVLAKSMPVLASQIVAEIKRHTGIEIARKLAAGPIRVPRDHEVQPLKPGENPPGKTTCGTCHLSWDDDKVTGMTPTPSGRCPFEYFHAEEQEVPERGLGPNAPDSALGLGGTASASGEVAIACDPTLLHLAKGEKRKIKELREQLQGEKDPAKIKSINDAIDSLYSRMDADKKRKEDRRQQREDKAKKDQEAADKEPAKFPATASFKGTLSLAGTVPYCDGCDNMKSLCKCNPKTASKSDHEDGGKHDPAAKGATETNVMKQGEGKLFKVVAVSSNTNSFGLHGVIMIAQDGEAWKAAHGQLQLPKQGDTLRIDPTAWGASGFEIPEKLPQPPAEVIAEAWGKGKQASVAGRAL